MFWGRRLVCEAVGLKEIQQRGSWLREKKMKITKRKGCRPGGRKKRKKSDGGLAAASHEGEEISSVF